MSQHLGAKVKTQMSQAVVRNLSPFVCQRRKSRTSSKDQVSSIPYRRGEVKNINSKYHTYTKKKKNRKYWIFQYRLERGSTRTLSPGRAHSQKKSLIGSSNPDRGRGSNKDSVPGKYPLPKKLKSLFGSSNTDRGGQLQELCPREVPPEKEKFRQCVIRI